ncbi:hypothetical protein PLESTM_000230700 [Pleodorina starrii]|nr:hypothetical protein PLESTM_000230700 [Pleodorina starrii]
MAARPDKNALESIGRTGRPQQQPPLPRPSKCPSRHSRRCFARHWRRPDSSHTLSVLPASSVRHWTSPSRREPRRPSCRLPPVVARDGPAAAVRPPLALARRRQVQDTEAASGVVNIITVTGTAVASWPSPPRRHRHCRRLMAVTFSPSPALPSPHGRQPPRRRFLTVTCTAVTSSPSPALPSPPRRRLLAVTFSPSPTLPSPPRRHLLAVTGTAVASSPSPPRRRLLAVTGTAVTFSPSPPRRHLHCRHLLAVASSPSPPRRRLLAVTFSPSPALPSTPRRQPPRRHLLAVTCTAVASSPSPALPSPAGGLQCRLVAATDARPRSRTGSMVALPGLPPATEVLVIGVTAFSRCPAR